MSVLSKLRYPLYPLYEARLKHELRGKKRPKHIAVMADGNRRWARESGFTDISHGHRVGGAKIGELVRFRLSRQADGRWCAQDVDRVAQRRRGAVRRAVSTDAPRIGWAPAIPRRIYRAS